MTNLIENSTWEAGIYQLETDDPTLGGPPGFNMGEPVTGHANAQAQQLANRTKYLKDTQETFVSDLANAMDPAKGAGMVGYAGGNVSEALDKRTIFVGSVAELEALSDPESGQQAILSKSSRTQVFKFSSNDETGRVSADPDKNYVIAPSYDATGASGAWIAEELDFQLFAPGRDFVDLGNSMARPERVFARKIDVAGEDRLVISILQSEESDGKKYITEYTLRPDTDGLMKLHTIRSGESGLVATSTYSVKSADTSGAWTESSPNWFTTEVGATFGFLTDPCDRVDLSFYTDDRGGLWNIQIVKPSGEVLKEQKISVHSAAPGGKTVTISEEMDRGIYLVRGIFLGEDPFNTPSATARGWLIAGTSDTSTFFDSANEGKLVAPSALLMNGSVYEFAIRCRPAGSTDAFNWIPDHGVTGSALGVSEFTYVSGDGVEPIFSWTDLAYDVPVEIKTFTLNQLFSGTHIASGTPIADIYMQHKFTKEGVNLNIRYRFYTDTEQEAAYLFMMPSNANSTPFLKSAALSQSDVRITANKDNSNTTHYPGVSYARWGGQVAPGRPVFHCTTIDTVAETLGGAKNLNRLQRLDESMLFSDRSDSVSKVYHYFQKPNTIIKKGTCLTTSIRINAGVLKNPIGGTSSTAIGLI